MKTVSNLLNIAHRGCTKKNKYADNSMKAFQRAIRKNYDGFELDIYLTADRVPVLIHEKGQCVGNVELINQSTGLSEVIKLKEKSYAELKNYLLLDQIQKISSFYEIIDEFGHFPI